MNPIRGSQRVRPRLRQILVAALAAASIGSCAASSNLVDMWKDPEAPAQPMRDVFVVVVQRDPITRRIWEDAFVNQLDRRGVSATPSYRMFPAAPPDTDKIERAVNGRGYEGVFIVHKLATETRKNYVPGYVTSVPVTRYNHWRNAYYTYFHDIYRPGYVESERVARYQVDVWSTGEEGRMVWSGTTETVNPTSARDASREVSRLVVPELAHTHLIPVK
jgi:hypothetical protein